MLIKAHDLAKNEYVTVLANVYNFIFLGDVLNLQHLCLLTLILIS